MSQEIIYTSAPRGLKPNSSGFCTVLSTSGMASNLSQRLEALSGYRFQFQAHEGKAHLNPVNYSHLKMTVGGESFHVLSRICDAGLDHTTRSNKLAHHVALKAREISPSAGSSPAWVMASPGFFETKWEGDPRCVPEGRKKLPDNPRANGPCVAWGEATGDPGWAGVLAGSARATPPQPMHVIFPPGTDTLPLVIEALHLLPPEKRWEVTFSTYFTKLEAGTDCLWRFILDGTPEAAALRRDPHKPKIDLCAELGAAPEDELVAAARSGQLPQWSDPEPATAAQCCERRTRGTAHRRRAAHAAVGFQPRAAHHSRSVIASLSPTGAPRSPPRDYRRLAVVVPVDYGRDGHGLPQAPLARGTASGSQEQ